MALKGCVQERERCLAIAGEGFKKTYEKQKMRNKDITMRARRVTTRQETKW
jgi:hypothetical protein